MFTWISIHREAAKVLLTYRNRQPDLVALLQRMHDAGLKALAITDYYAGGTQSPLQEIDPFTFLANFNRPNTRDNRVALWAFLKQEWKLAASVLTDFDGLPLMNHQKSWLIPWAEERDARHVPDLWDFFEHALTCPVHQLDTVLMECCMSHKHTALTVLTMGMFWIRPDTWISADGKNVGYAQHLGCLIAKPKTAVGYPDWLDAMKKLAAGDAAKFSHDAHLWSKGVIAPKKNIRYWLIAPGERARLMPVCIEEEIISLGWGELTDMNGYKDRSQVESILEKSNPAVNPRQATGMIWQFAHEIAIGDYVFAKKGTTELVGWGVVTGNYFYNPDGDEYFHTRLVEWRSLKIVPSEKQLPNKTLTEKTDDEVFRALVDKQYGIAIDLTPEPDIYTLDQALTEIFMERPQLETILRRLRDKKNIILQGAPGVGKTFIARRLAHLMLGTRDDSTIQMIQFHPSYSYEDFVQGIKPCPDSGKFIVQDGIFHRFCERAASDNDKPYFLIIDEINLGKILGELMMLIETDKRGQKLTLTYSGEPFSVPPNLHLIGTMNTADRSLSMVDYALRRRFSFITLHPGFETDSFKKHLVAQNISPSQIEHLIGLMTNLNLEIANDTVNLGTGYRIGHSFFTPIRRVDDFALWSRDIIEHEILPLLEEYWMDELETVALHKKKLLANGA